MITDHPLQAITREAFIPIFAPQLPKRFAIPLGNALEERCFLYGRWIHSVIIMMGLCHGDSPIFNPLPSLPHQRN
jgi:hypothetical protein